MINPIHIFLPPLPPAMVLHQREGLGKGKRDALSLNFPIPLVGCWVSAGNISMPKFAFLSSKSINLNDETYLKNEIAAV